MKGQSRARSKRSGFRSLRVSPGFRDFVVDQLATVRDLHAKPMFGGLGLYAGDTFFGIVAADILYLKVGEANRADVTRAGATPFTPYANRNASKSYYSVPVSVLEHPAELSRWVARAIRVAQERRDRSRSRSAKER